MEHAESLNHGIPPGHPVKEKGIWKRWVSDLRVTWIWGLLLTVVPAALFGSALLPMMVLIGAVLLGIPTALITFLVVKDKANRLRLCRKLAVMFVVSGLSVVVVSQTDKQTPRMASPIAKAIEDFKQQTGAYPETLADLIPRHLPSLPDVRISAVQPEVIYRVKDGSPYLAVPSATGDAFAVYEYSFEEKRWAHHN